MLSRLFALLLLLCALAPTALTAHPYVHHHYRHHVVRRVAVRHVTPKSVTVWVNTKAGVYHYPGERWYGNKEQGEYMPENQAIADGYRAPENGQ